MNEQSKANEWEFWDFDISAYLRTTKKEQSKNSINKDDDCQCKTNGSLVDCPKDHILPSHIEAADAMHEEDEVDLAWREFDSYESVMGSPNIHRQDEQSDDIIETKKSPPAPTRKQPTKSLSASRDKSQSPPRRLIDVKSNTRGARAA